FLLLRHAGSGNPWTLAASAVLAGLAALTKIETALAIAVAHGAFFLSVLPRPSGPRVAAWALGPAVAVGGYLVAAHQWGGVVWRSLFELLHPASRFYISNSMGARRPLAAIGEGALSAVGWALVLGAVLWAARRVDGPPERRRLALGLAWIVAFIVPALVLERMFF